MSTVDTSPREVITMEALLEATDKLNPENCFDFDNVGITVVSDTATKRLFALMGLIEGVMQHFEEKGKVGIPVQSPSSFSAILNCGGEFRLNIETKDDPDDYRKSIAKLSFGLRMGQTAFHFAGHDGSLCAMLCSKEFLENSSDFGPACKNILTQIQVEKHV